MRPTRLTEAELMAHASRACEYFAAHPAENLFRMHMKVEEDHRVYRERYPTVEVDATPVLEIKRPPVSGAGGLGEAVKGMALYWALFNQIFEQHTRLMGDRL